MLRRLFVVQKLVVVRGRVPRVIIMVEFRDKLHEFPEGFLGWAGNMSQAASINLYASSIPSNYITEEYEKYAQTIGLEMLTFKPKRAGETLNDVFFKLPRAFSYHFTHEDFSIESIATGYTLGEFLNFPSLDDITMSDERKTRQLLFLKEFIGSYKGFQAGKVTMKEDQGMAGLEMMDKSYFICLGLAHGAPETVIYDEVGIRGEDNNAVPHGNIDLLFLPKLHETQVWRYTVS